MADYQQNNKKKRRPENTFEAYESVGEAVKKNVTEMVKTGLGQIFSGELKPGETVELTAEDVAERQALIENQRVVQEIYAAETQAEIARLEETKKEIEKKIGQLIQAIQKEAKAFNEAAAAMSKEAVKITVEQKPTKPGRYHENFFEWVLRVLRELRQEINKSRTWLDLWTQKRKARGYWAMFKKHGTSFALSQERGIAASVG